ncbi:hypothetical protein [Frankia gtarii]|uniref:hypothetical protein n=1 Tax=Frankia gtarii TaxID=2950102 RepID=UPI0021C10F5C|nr:hypothetical protein [Frankia gtarii]
MGDLVLGLQEESQPSTPGTPRVAQVERRSLNVTVANALHSLFGAVAATFRFVPDGPDFRVPG